MKSIQKIVVKVGTSTLTQGTQKLSRRFMLELSRQLAHLHEQGKEVVLVTSGAVAAGGDRLKQCSAACTMPSKQMLAAIGQVQLMQTWTELFSLWELQVAQVLLTRHDFVDEHTHIARDTLSSLFQHRIIPVVNENDAVANKDFRIGDNDNLAALVANLIGADLLILLTDQQGLYTADPRVDSAATLIPLIHQVDESIIQMAKGSATGLGTGGMTTKIQAASVAVQGGIETVIAWSSHPNVLNEITCGKQVGTRFIASAKRGGMYA